MHEFDKCNFCGSSVKDDENDRCKHPYCFAHSDFSLDVNKILNKADKLNISVTDVLNLMREVNR
jgi:hypothetical protein